MQAWSADTKGSEYFSIRVRDWATGTDRDDLVEETDGGIVWSKDCNSFFYVKLDDNHRPALCPAYGARPASGDGCRRA